MRRRLRRVDWWGVGWVAASLIAAASWFALGYLATEAIVGALSHDNT